MSKDVEVTQEDIDGISFAVNIPEKEIRRMKIKAKAFSDEEEARKFSDGVTLLTMKLAPLANGDMEVTVFYMESED